MLEGAGSIGQSVLRGFKGLISQPVQGAKRQGAVGKHVLSGEGNVKLDWWGALNLISQPVQGAKRQGAVGERLFGEAGSKLLCVRGRSA